jgi:outer membrane protein assembly factor BamB
MRLALVVALLVLCACTSSGGARTTPSATPVSAAPPITATQSSSGASTPAPSTPAPSTPADWPTYHGSFDRSGVSTDMPAVSGPLRLAHALELDGQVYASPIVVGGITVVATERDIVYGFDASFRQLWKEDLGDPSPAQERPCGDIDPLGITGTPVYLDGLVYLVAEHGGAIRHELIALDLKTGTVRWRRGIDVPGPDPTVMQQRGALTVSGGKVWAPFGALAGDCGDYKGRVVGVQADGSGPLTVFDPSSRKQGGIWNPAGGTVDANGDMYYVSANGSSFPGDSYDHTNSVDKINTNGKLLDSFAPIDWAENNRGDVGLGSQGVSFVGDKWVVLGGKSGPVYVLRRDQLGGIGGQVSVQNICLSFGGAAVVGDVIYLPCTDGVRAVRVDDTGHLHVLWHADEKVAGSPVVGGGRVWALDQTGGVLHALDPRSGKTLEQVDVGETSRFATPALYGSDVLVPTLAGLSVVTAGK